MATNSGADMDAVKADLAALKQDVAALTERAREWSMEEARQATQAVSHEIEVHPFVSILAAFGLGMVSDRLLRRCGL